MRRLNKTAPIGLTNLETALDPSMLWDGRFGSFSQPCNRHREPTTDRCTTNDRSGCTDAGCTLEGSTASLHNDLVHTHSFIREDPIAPELLDRWLTSLLDLRGPDLLRFKAIVNVAGLMGPLVLHGVQHVIHPPLALRAWPSSDQRTRMVFITFGIEETAFRSSLKLLETE